MPCNIRKLLVLSLAISALLGSRCFADSWDTTLIPETAKSADSFVDTVGVDLHLSYASYQLTPTYFQDVLRPRILELGVRHLKNFSLSPNGSTTTTLTTEMADLSAQGMKWTLGLSPYTSSTYNIWDDPNGRLLDKFHALMNGGTTGGGTFVAVSNIEAILLGPNETDHCGMGESCYSAGNDFLTRINAKFPGWEDALLSYSPDAYSTLKNDSVTAQIPNIIAAPLVHINEYKNVMKGGQTLWNYMHPVVSSADLGTVHLYCHTSGVPSCATNWLAPWEEFYGPLPIWITEFGNTTAPNTVNAVTEEVQAKYLSRGLLELYKRGIPRTFIYELLDEGAFESSPFHGYFGLVRQDGTAKPAFTTISNLLNILSDQSGSFTLNTLSYSIDGGDSNLHHLLLQKASGTFYLVLWNETASSITNDVIQSVTVNLGAPKWLKLYLPRVSRTAVIENPESSSIALSVPDAPIILEIAALAPTPTPTSIPPSTGNGSPSPTPDTGTGCAIKVTKKASKVRAKISDQLGTPMIGERLILQRRRGGSWRNVATRASDKKGVAKFSAHLKKRTGRVTSSRCTSKSF